MTHSVASAAGASWLNVRRFGCPCGVHFSSSLCARRRPRLRVLVAQTASWGPRGDAGESCALVRYVCGDRCRHSEGQAPQAEHLAQRWQTLRRTSGPATR